MQGLTAPHSPTPQVTLAATNSVLVVQLMSCERGKLGTPGFEAEEHKAVQQMQETLRALETTLVEQRVRQVREREREREWTRARYPTPIFAPNHWAIATRAAGEPAVCAVLPAGERPQRRRHAAIRACVPHLHTHTRARLPGEAQSTRR
jgi:hypothetical protein